MIKQFIRGDPFKSLNIGKRAQIENWFKTWASYVEYKIDDDLNIRVKESLIFYGSKITYLPDNLHIEGWLDLRRSKIISLPDNLHIDGWLDLGRSKIISLPNNLYVEGYLNLERTKIVSLPDDLYVGEKTHKYF